MNKTYVIEMQLQGKTPTVRCWIEGTYEQALEEFHTELGMFFRQFMSTKNLPYEELLERLNKLSENYAEYNGNSLTLKQKDI